MENLDVSTRLGSRANSSTAHLNPIMKRFAKPLLPASFVGETESAVNSQARHEITTRQKRVDALYKQRVERLATFESHEQAYREFVALADSFIDADNARIPTAAQNQTINELNASISDVVLSGDQAAGTPRAQTAAKISARLLKLQEMSDQSRKLWDATVKDHEEETKSLKQLEENSGIDGGAIQGNAMLYCPYREEKTMIRSSDEIIIELWNRINGPGMLELRFDRLKSSLTDLRKSILAETRKFGPSKSEIIFFNFQKLTYY